MARHKFLYREKTSVKNIALLLFALLICQFAGILGSLFTTPVIDTWYAGLEKPWFTPPDFVFAPVWTALFVLMGISLYLILVSGKKKIGLGVSFFGLQLVLNALWSMLFFGLQNPYMAFLEIVFLWVVILATIWQFSKHSLLAGWLLVPYGVWVAFAGLLNYMIWSLN